MLRRKLGTNERRKEQRGSKREWKAGRKEKWSVRGKKKKEKRERKKERKEETKEGLTCVHPCQFVWRERFFFLWKTYTLHQQGRSRGRFLQHKIRLHLVTRILLRISLQEQEAT